MNKTQKNEEMSLSNMEKHDLFQNKAQFGSNLNTLVIMLP